MYGENFLQSTKFDNVALLPVFLGGALLTVYRVEVFRYGYAKTNEVFLDERRDTATPPLSTNPRFHSFSLALVALYRLASVAPLLAASTLTFIHVHPRPSSARSPASLFTLAVFSFEFLASLLRSLPFSQFSFVTFVRLFSSRFVFRF